MRISDKIRACDRPFYSLEFFPPKNSEDLPVFYETAKKLKAMAPLFTSVTCGAGGSGSRNTLAVAKTLKNELGLEPIPHFTCVEATPESIDAFLSELDEAGIDNVLALRGDKPRHAPEDWEPGIYRHADDLVRHFRRSAPDLAIGVAAYPAPHPESPSFATDRHYLSQKLTAGADFAVTQLFFDVREYIDLVDRLNSEGITCPIIPGILPIQSLSSLKHALSTCGANIQGKLFLAFEKANEEGGTEAVREAGIDFAAGQIRRLIDAGAPGIHLYTLNKAELCLELMERVGKL